MSVAQRRIAPQAVYLAKAAARRVRYGPSDLLRRDADGGLRPPRRLSFVGGGDFEQTGQQFLGFFRELGGLQPDARVLDVGCGIGRMAVPLIEYLEEGSYAGFDIGREMVRWCRRRIGARRPDFEFTWAPVYNGKYNPFGRVAPAEFRFPYDDASFDFAFATSVFTHLLRDDARHYLDEVARVLRPGATCLLTFFLLTPEAQRGIAAGEAMLPFDHPTDGGLVISRREPEAAVAYPATDVCEWMAAAGLRVREPIHHGVWSGAPEGLTLQDIVIAERV